MTKINEIQKDNSSKRTWNKIHLLPIIVIVLGLISTLLSSIIAENFVTFFGLLLTVTLATLLVGVFLGFLFGIPKLNKEFNPSDDYKQRNKYKPNTNLEDISDWLTKIIVGVSLTQATKIPNFLENIARSILSENECAFNCDYAHAIIISLIIFFAISGFIIGYFYTRLYLPNLFSIMEENKQQIEEISIWKGGWNKSSIMKKEGVTEGESSDINNLLSLFTSEEIEILRLIKQHNNNYIISERLGFKLQAAISVLIEKGIIYIVQVGSFRTGATLKIKDKDIENALN